MAGKTRPVVRLRREGCSSGQDSGRGPANGAVSSHGGAELGPRNSGRQAGRGQRRERPQAAILFTLAFLILLSLLKQGLQLLARLLMRRTDVRAGFWSRQGIQLAVAVVGLLGVLSIWFDNPDRLTMVFGLVTAGLAFALQ